MEKYLRSIDQWIEILGSQDATYMGDAEASAHAILNRMGGYRHNSKLREDDVKQLANAIQAYAKMLQDAGVTVVA